MHQVMEAERAQFQFYYPAVLTLTGVNAALAIFMLVALGRADSPD